MQKKDLNKLDLEVGYLKKEFYDFKRDITEKTNINEEKINQLSTNFELMFINTNIKFESISNKFKVMENNKKTNYLFFVSSIILLLIFYILYFYI